MKNNIQYIESLQKFKFAIMKKTIFSYKYVFRGIFSLLLLVLMYIPIHANAITVSPTLIQTQQQFVGAAQLMYAPPTVTTLGATPGTTTAVLNGYFSGSASDPTYTEFLWGTVSPAGLPNETGFIKQSAVSGNFQENISGLTPNTQYYVQALAKNQKGGASHAAATVFFTTNSITPPPTCVINFFQSNATNNTINTYGSTTLSWSQNNCTTLTLSSSDARFANTSVYNQTQISTGALGATTSYVLTGTDANGTIAQKNVTIKVVPPGTSTDACQIYSFTANGTTYAQVYYGASANITWNTSTGCRYVGISGDNGVNFGNQENIGTILVRPFHNTVVYTLTATDADGVSKTSQITVFVYGGGGPNGDCTIISFYSSGQYVNSGQTVTIYWATAGCTNVSITGTSNSIPFTYSLPSNGSVQTNPLYATSNFVITANGNVSATFTPITVYVAGGPYPYNGNIVSNSSSAAITGIATNIGSTSVRLNGVYVGSTQVGAWFEYGTDSSMTLSTRQQDFNDNTSHTYSDTIYTNPNTTYYYRAVVRTNGSISRGDTMTVITKGSGDTAVYVQNTNTTNTTVATTTSGVTLAITDPSEKVYIGDTVDYTINYANGTNKKISNTKINIVLPQGFQLVQTTQGQAISPTIINADIGMLTPGQTGTIFLQAKVTNTVSLSNTLITNGTMSFTYPNGSNDSTVGYVLNHAGGISSLGGFSLGAGFFPTTILGWIVTILIILAVILTIRRIARTKNGGAAAHH